MIGIVRYHRRAIQIIFLLISCYALSSSAASSNSNFMPVKLPRGIELQLPKGWRLFSADQNQMLQTSAEAAMDLLDVDLPDGQKTNLIAAYSIPNSTYAAVRIDSTIPPSSTPSEVASITPADIRELKSIMRQNLGKMLPLQGNQLIEYLGSHIEKISGHPTIVTEYRRTGPKGSVFVQLNQIYTPNQEISLNLSYRESEAAIWKPVIGKIRKSIVIEN